MESKYDNFVVNFETKEIDSNETIKPIVDYGKTLVDKDGREVKYLYKRHTDSDFKYVCAVKDCFGYESIICFDKYGDHSILSSNASIRNKKTKATFFANVYKDHTDTVSCGGIYSSKKEALSMRNTNFSTFHMVSFSVEI